jgi:hypothetical protein
MNPVDPQLERRMVSTLETGDVISWFHSLLSNSTYLYRYVAVVSGSCGKNHTVVVTDTGASWAWWGLHKL